MLSQAVGYAALSLGFLAAHQDRTALVRDIAEACEIPSPYLSKIINQLSRAGLVRTQRGVGGGAKLAREPESISLLDLCEVLNDPAIQNRCMLGATSCSDRRHCPAHAYNSERRDELMAYLRSMSIADIAAHQKADNENPLTAVSEHHVAITNGMSSTMSNGHGSNGHGSNGHTGNGNGYSNGHA